MTEPAGDRWPPVAASGPSQPRIYDLLLGGKDNFAADRALAEKMLERFPDLPRLAKVNRRFVLAAAEWVAAGGTGQFIDLGCGLPPPAPRKALHDAARDGCRDARVVYVDRDPVVVCHVAALQSGDGLAAVQADAADPETTLARVRGTLLIDMRRPVCVVLGATLSTMRPDVAARAVRGYMAALAPGSSAVISCAHFDDPRVAGEITAAFSAAGEWHNHSAGDVGRFLGGLRIEGGLVRDVRPWCWPQFQEEIPGASVFGGIGVRP